MKTGFYPGCSMKGSAREYHESLMAVATAMGRELPEIPDWNCCGATAAHNLDRDLALALPARILAAAERAGMDNVLVPCAACYSRLSVTRHELLADEGLRRKISGLIEADYRGTARVLNILEWLAAIPGLENMIMQPFAHRVACYYGCLMVRPAGIVNFDRPEEPQSMDLLLKRIGAEPLDWAFKTECCGAGFSVSRTDLVARLSGLILDDAVARGAEAVIVACPMCHLNLDMRRPAIEKSSGKKYDIPVLYVTQALGLAMGIEAKKLGLRRHKVAVKFSSAGSPSNAAGKPMATEKTASKEG